MNSVLLSSMQKFITFIEKNNEVNTLFIVIINVLVIIIGQGNHSSNFFLIFNSIQERSSDFFKAKKLLKIRVISLA